MFSKLHRDWVGSVSRGDPAFVLPIGIVAVVVFLPTLSILLVEWRFKTFDMFPGSRMVLPWSIAFTTIVLAIGLVLTFYGIRNIAYPGSLLYRLTHATPRRPG